MEYLIRTYTNPGELVLDNTMGSGTTIVAALNTGRRAIGMERSPEYFEIARKRLETAPMAMCRHRPGRSSRALSCDVLCVMCAAISDTRGAVVYVTTYRFGSSAPATKLNLANLHIW
jgi:hypothetical protein